MNGFHQRGSAILAVLIITALISLLAFRAWRYASRETIVLGDNLHSGLAYDESLKSIETLAEMPRADKRRFHCTPASAQRGRITVSRAACGVSTPTDSSIFDGAAIDLRELPASRSPLIDYNLLFADADTCSGSPRECTIASEVRAPLAVIGDLKGGVTAIVSDDSSVPVTIAATGAIQITTLTVSAPALIVSGGSLTIEMIQTSSTEPVEVTLLSAGSAVTVTAYGEGIRLKAIARGEIQLPVTASVDPAQLLPPLRSLQALGLADIAENSP